MYISAVPVKILGARASGTYHMMSQKPIIPYIITQALALGSKSETVNTRPSITVGPGTNEIATQRLNWYLVA